MDLVNLLMPVLIISAVYFFIMKPQRDLQKKQEGFLEGLSKGTDIVTTSGIHGRINKIEDDIVTLQIDIKTFIRINKGAISREMTEQISSNTGKAKQSDQKEQNKSVDKKAKQS